MFAPQGYYSVSEVLGICREVARHAGIARSVRASSVGYQSATEVERKIEIDLLEAWLLANVIERSDTQICSENGIVLRAVNFLRYHEDQLAWYDWDWPLDGECDLTPAYERARMDYIPDSITDEIVKLGLRTAVDFLPLNRFRFLCPASGSVQVASRLDLLRQFSNETGEGMETLISVASKVDGWCYCFPMSAVPSNLVAFSSKYAESLAFEKMIDQAVTFDCSVRGVSAGVGRPRLQDRAKQAYLAAYPNGRGDAHWSEVERRVSSMLGQRVSQKTISRALKGS